MQKEQVKDFENTSETPRMVSTVDDKQGLETCGAIIAKCGKKGRCKGKPVIDDRFCYHHSERISPELEELDNLLNEHKEDFFCNHDVKHKVEKLLEGFRPCTRVDREFAAKLADRWEKVRRQKVWRQKMRRQMA